MTACGATDDSGGASPVDERAVSATDDSSRDSSGRGSGEIPSRGSRDTGIVGESAGPGERGPDDGPVAAEWPDNDVYGAIPRVRPGTGRRDAVLLTYDAGAADGFGAAVRAAASSWNERVPEIELRPARPGAEPDIRVVVTKGWPGAAPQGAVLGKGTVSIGRRALAQGHDAIRLVAHEFGHLLGLKDSQAGACSSVMSGKSAGASCTNSYPSAAEVREVRGNFG
ncbi:snapalysin family zinc-dependent metalloprotease [Streptomyces winkii]|uniref:snapalysin family zinc-dependent metalloprotease n=1 Tax=Streptomyces winkii TaxID=3051178 RepID=UPI0028D03E88|nr:snapalysin family zinc-dependent metalloprotease [Streptomyces sp. DSM 40971]